MKKYEFKVNQAEKILLIESRGMFSLEDAKNFMDEYKKTITKINPGDYVLIIDSKDIKTANQEVIPLLEDMIKLYVTTPFKKRITIVMDSAVALSQVKRVGKDDFTNNFIFVNSYEEALNVAK